MFKTHLLYSFIKILSYNFSFSIIIKFYLHYCCDFDYFIFNIFNILFDLFSLWYCFVSTLPVMARPRTTLLTWEVPTPEFLMGLTQVQHFIISARIKPVLGYTEIWYRIVKKKKKINNSCYVGLVHRTLGVNKTGFNLIFFILLSAENCL